MRSPEEAAEYQALSVLLQRRNDEFVSYIEHTYGEGHDAPLTRDVVLADGLWYVMHRFAMGVTMEGTPAAREEGLVEIAAIVTGEADDGNLAAYVLGIIGFYTGLHRSLGNMREVEALQKLMDAIGKGGFEPVQRYNEIGGRFARQLEAAVAAIPEYETAPKPLSHSMYDAIEVMVLLWGSDIFDGFIPKPGDFEMFCLAIRLLGNDNPRLAHMILSDEANDYATYVQPSEWTQKVRLGYQMLLDELPDR